MKPVNCILAVVVIFAASWAASAQATSPSFGKGVKKHKNIDRIYSDFTRGYETFDEDLVAGLYTEDAEYLSPNEDFVSGRDQIRSNFEGFFENVKSSGRTVSIAFRIKTRLVSDGLGYDVGTFEITFKKIGRVVGNSTGKFVVVTVLDKDGKWRFAVDGYSGLAPPQVKE